jgi:predicted lipid-binding transport protein (Tim44 family)
MRQKPPKPQTIKNQSPQGTAMTSISGIAYLIIGIFIAGASFILNKKTGSNALTMFMVIGIIFIIIGVVKLILNRPATRPQPTSHATHHPTPQHPAPSHNPQPTTQAHPASVQTSPPHPTHAARPAHAFPSKATTKADAASAPFLSASPHNKVEEAVLQQEMKESHTQPIQHPPIIICPSCKRRQYKTRDACFHCHQPL